MNCLFLVIDRQPQVSESYHHQPVNRTASMPGFMHQSHMGRRVKAASSFPQIIPQIRQRMETQNDRDEEEEEVEALERPNYFTDSQEFRQRQASLLKINLAKKHSSDGKHLYMPSEF